MKLFDNGVSEWTDVFSAIGNDERLSIMIVLSSSDYIKHSHKVPTVTDSEGCLPFSDIAKSTEINSATRLSYHLSKLIDAGLVSKIPAKDANERVFPLYKVTARWQKFAEEFGFHSKIKDFIKAKYPESFNEKAP
jgi:DNA-binding transcriptional ArsR family regulator